jgi:hypothetical protein
MALLLRLFSLLGAPEQLVILSRAGGHLNNQSNQLKIYILTIPILTWDFSE